MKRNEPYLASYDNLMIVYLVYVFYDKWPFCSVIRNANINLKSRKYLNDNSSKTTKRYDTNLVEMMLGLGQFKIAKILPLVWLP